LEKEHATLQEEATNLRHQMERMRQEKRSTEDFLQETQQTLQLLQDENEQLVESSKREKLERDREKSESSAVIEGLSGELEQIRRSQTPRTNPLLTVNSTEDDFSTVNIDAVDCCSRVAELENELKKARENIKSLALDNEDLRGQVLQAAHRQGSLLIQKGSGDSKGDISIGDEINRLSEEEVRPKVLASKPMASASLLYATMVFFCCTLLHLLKPSFCYITVALALRCFSTGWLQSAHLGA
jgi:DNA repair exonuclease SbcCD ATPase subunit